MPFRTGRGERWPCRSAGKGKDYLLRVKDNGVGLPGDIDLKKVESLGLQLVETLSTQIGASIDVTTAPGKGTAFAISFPAH